LPFEPISSSPDSSNAGNALGTINQRKSKRSRGANLFALKLPFLLNHTVYRIAALACEQ
jgi:hypothetical protein